MLGVILGAGASYDSFEDVPAPRPPDPEPPVDMRSTGLAIHGDRPDLGLGLDIERLPLANHLFDGRESFSSVIEQYPQVRSIAARLKRTTNLEAELDLIAEEGADDPQVGRQLVATRFYLRSVIALAQTSLANETHGVDNYHTLLDEIRKWQLQTGSEVCLITFNYDTLLEDACVDSFAEFGQPIDLDWYMESHPKIRVYKPHGSITWEQEVTSTSRTDPASLINHGWDLQPGDQFHYGQPGPKPRNSPLWGLPLLPALALPYQAKPNQFVMPPQHKRMLEQDLNNMTTVLIVGWRATEQHFLELWQRNKPERVVGFIVNGAHHTSDAAAKNLRLARCLNEAIPEDMGFSEFVSTRAFNNLFPAN